MSSSAFLALLPGIVSAVVFFLKYVVSRRDREAGRLEQRERDRELEVDRAREARDIRRKVDAMPRRDLERELRGE